MKHILVPLDGSGCAEQVLPYVQRLAPLLDASIHLLRVVPYEDADAIFLESVAALVGSDGPTAVGRDRRDEREQVHYAQAESYLAAQAERFRQHGIEVELDVQIGHPADAIMEAAAHTDVTMIAMGTHCLDGLQRWALGSIANQVVHATTAPILLVRNTCQRSRDMDRFRQILVPLDGSAAAAIALPIATAIAQRAEASLTLVQAVVPTLELYPDSRPNGAQPSYHAMLTVLHDRAQAELVATSAALQHGGLRVTPVVATGDPAEVIVREAQRRCVDLIVMATHGTSGARRWAVGSVADTVLHGSSIPLLLVHVKS